MIRPETRVASELVLEMYDSSNALIKMSCTRHCTESLGVKWM